LGVPLIMVPDKSVQDAVEMVAARFQRDPTDAE
jgi:hypothetical protein